MICPSCQRLIPHAISPCDCAVQMPKAKRDALIAGGLEPANASQFLSEIDSELPSKTIEK